MDKNQFKLNKSEIKALFNMLTIADFQAIDDEMKQVYIRFILEKIYFKLAKKIARVVDQCTITLHTAECLSLYEALNTIDDIDLPNYERVVKQQIVDQIHAKYIA